MREDIICAGFGGQGIVFLGKLVAYAAMEEGKFVTYMPSYGAEVRGGTAHSMIKISQEEIPSPLVSHPTSVIIMNQPSFDRFSKKMTGGATMVLNSSMAKANTKDINVINIPMTEIATKIGDVRVANMVGLGAYLAKIKILKIDTAKKILEKLFKDKKDLLRLNLLALNKGYRYKLKR